MQTKVVDDIPHYDLIKLLVFWINATLYTF